MLVAVAVRKSVVASMTESFPTGLADSRLGTVRCFRI